MTKFSKPQSARDLSDGEKDYLFWRHTPPVKDSSFSKVTRRSPTNVVAAAQKAPRVHFRPAGSIQLFAFVNFNAPTRASEQSFRAAAPRVKCPKYKLGEFVDVATEGPLFDRSRIIPVA